MKTQYVCLIMLVVGLLVLGVLVGNFTISNAKSLRGHYEKLYSQNY